MSALAKSIRAQSKARFTRALSKLNVAIDSRLLTTTVRNRYEVLKQEWETVQLRHDEYVTLLTDPTPDDEEWIDLLSNEFDATEEKADKFLFEREDEEKRHNDRQQTEEKAKEEEESKRLADEQKINRLRVTLEQEITKFDIAADSIKSLLEGYSSDRNDLPALASTVAEAKKRLDKQFTTCEGVHNEIALTVAGDERAKEREYMSSITKIYYNLSDKSQLFISKFNTPKPSQTTPTTSTSVAGLRMEKLKFPPFEGDCRKYPRFKEQFLRHIKPLYHVDQEAFALRSYLSDTVREETEAFGEDAEAAWARLDAKYGNEGKMIDSIMNDIKGMSRVSDEKPVEVLAMIETIEKAYRDLKCLGLEGEMRNATIVSLIEERLPNKLKDKWLDVITGDKWGSSSKRDKFPALLDLLVRYRERLEYDMSELRSGESKHGAAHGVSEEQKPKSDDARVYPWCWLHPDSNDHPIWRCEEFQQTPAGERIELMRKHHACFGCLGQGHVQWKCRRNFKCRVDNCGMKHHQLLHDAHVEGIAFHANQKKKEGKKLLQIQEIKSKGENGKSIDLNVMWDNGSTLCFITFQKANAMRLRGNDVNLHLSTVGAQTENIKSKRYKLQLIDKRENLVEINVYGIEKISSVVPEFDIDEAIKEFEGSSSTPISRPNFGQIDCLIGIEYANYHPVKIDAKGHLLLLENLFGRIVAGCYKKEIATDEKRVEHGETYHAIGNAAEFFSTEQLGIQCQPKCGGCRCGKCHLGGKNMTIKEEKELELIESKLKYNDEGNYWEAGYPWIKDPENLPDNKIVAISSLKALERRLKKDEKQANLYQQQIEDMIARGVCRKLSDSEIENYRGPKFYIPHHAVYKPESDSTPCRIVFNSSANFRGHSLNEYYAKGPDLMNNLIGVLTRFREEHVAFMGDIRKMFHSIRIPLRDQMTHRFLWRDGEEHRRPDTYVITRVNFGDKPSPSMAIAALRKTADRFQNDFPDAAKTIKENSYVDDILDSVKSNTEANQTISNINTVLEKGGFSVKEWHVSKDEKSSSGNESNSLLVDSLARKSEIERVLGMKWNKAADTVGFQCRAEWKTKEKTKENQRNSDLLIEKGHSLKLTKRSILSQVNGIYDPLGLVAPFTVKAKIMLRKLWLHEEKLDWDDEIPENLQLEWRQFFDDFKLLQEIDFHRCTKPNDAIGEPSLVLFSDASNDAYGAVAYARWQIEDNKYESRIILSKNRIAPIKVTNIVRLELSGAVISKRIREIIEEESRYSFENVYHIVDSEVVRAMIGKESYGFNTFVANRLGEIQSVTAVEEWYWTAGENNIADLLTHGKRPTEIGENSTWQKGPDFLSKPIPEWPVSQSTEITELPERKNFVGVTATIQKENLMDRIDISRFSSYERLIRVTAKILSLYDRFKSENQGKIVDCEARKYLEQAEMLWLLEVQKDLKEKVANGKLKRHCPRIKDGLLVVGGRVERWMENTWNQQEFILLPKNHRLSYLLAHKIHRGGGHPGVAATIAKIRSRFWILGIQSLVKSLCHKCVICRIKFERLHGQIMGQLPDERLNPAPPFTTIGLDFFGPFEIKGEVQKRIRGKCYGVVFATRSSIKGVEEHSQRV